MLVLRTPVQEVGGAGPLFRRLLDQQRDSLALLVVSVQEIGRKALFGLEVVEVPEPLHVRFELPAHFEEHEARSVDIYFLARETADHAFSCIL